MAVSMSINWSDYVVAAVAFIHGVFFFFFFFIGRVTVTFGRDVSG